jgi:hypothetical protein
LQAAGLVASQSGGAITIASNNGTAFRLNALVPGQDNFGFGTTQRISLPPIKTADLD